MIGSRHLRRKSGSGCFLFGAARSAGGLVVAVRVEGQFADEFAGGGVDDADVQVLDEHQDAGPGVGAADAACDCLCPAGRPSSTSGT